MLNYQKHLLEMDKVLSPNGFERFFASGVDLSDGVSSYGRGTWEIAFANGFRTYTKIGTAFGFQSHCAMVRDLKLGVFSWSNLGINELLVSHINAIIMNAMVPAIVKEVVQNQPKHDVLDQSVMDKILGNYSSMSGKLTIKEDSDTATTGVYGGSFSLPVEFFYDKTTTEAYNQPDNYFFRMYTLRIPDMYGSCFMNSMQSFYNALVQFNCSGTCSVLVVDSYTLLRKEQ